MSDGRKYHSLSCTAVTKEYTVLFLIYKCCPDTTFCVAGIDQDSFV